MEEFLIYGKDWCVNEEVYYLVPAKLSWARIKLNLSMLAAIYGHNMFLDLHDITSGFDEKFQAEDYTGCLEHVRTVVARSGLLLSPERAYILVYNLSVNLSLDGYRQILKDMLNAAQIREVIRLSVAVEDGGYFSFECVLCRKKAVTSFGKFSEHVLACRECTGFSRDVARALRPSLRGKDNVADAMWVVNRAAAGVLQLLLVLSFQTLRPLGRAELVAELLAQQFGGLFVLVNKLLGRYGTQVAWHGGVTCGEKI